MTTESSVTPGAASAPAPVSPPVDSPAPAHEVSSSATAKITTLRTLLMTFLLSRRGDKARDRPVDAAREDEDDDDEHHAEHRERQVLCHVRAQVQPVGEFFGSRLHVDQRERAPARAPQAADPAE